MPTYIVVQVEADARIERGRFHRRGDAILWWQSLEYVERDNTFEMDVL